MNTPTPSPSPACCEQVFLIEADAGLLCRILGLYAARALQVLQVDYAPDAQALMRLRVSVDGRATQAELLADTLQVLLAKAATFVGVFAACDRADQPELRGECDPVRLCPAPTRAGAHRGG